LRAGLAALVRLADAIAAEPVDLTGAIGQRGGSAVDGTALAVLGRTASEVAAEVDARLAIRGTRVAVLRIGVTESVAAFGGVVVTTVFNARGLLADLADPIATHGLAAFSVHTGARRTADSIGEFSTGLGPP
jgi:hypothetical protein